MSNEFILKHPIRSNSEYLYRQEQSERAAREMQTMDIDRLKPFHKHPFKLYTGQRYLDMLESIKSNGILQPLLVRPSDSGYEILSGHNRFECAKAAGLSEVPVIITDVDDDEAQLIVTETNLYQRSFSDLSHSERARIITLHMEENKRQGKRTDLIDKVKDLLAETSRQVGAKLNTKEELSEQYGLSPRQITRYLRIDKLSDELKARIDNGNIPFNAGVELSYLTADEQDILEKYLETEEYKIDTKKSELLRELSAGGKLNESLTEQVLCGICDKKTTVKRQPITLSPSLITRYFGVYMNDTEVVGIIDTLLDIYTANHALFSDGQTNEQIKQIYRQALLKYFQADTDNQHAPQSEKSV